jgi:hypothetical protein
MFIDPEKRMPAADTPPSSTSPSAASDLDHVAKSNSGANGDRNAYDLPDHDGLTRRIDPLRHLHSLLVELKRRMTTSK